MPLRKYNSDDINAAFQRKEYEWVLQQALPHASAGNPVAQSTVSLLYQCALGVERDLLKAEEWLLKAAAQNDPVAWNNLGTLYAIGACSGGFPQWEGKAQSCYERAKELGFDCAQPYPPPSVCCPSTAPES
jgi:TPR repeat protein